MTDSRAQDDTTEGSRARPATTRASRAVRGERRIITVLFCDVKDSTAMAEQLDPEDWAEIMNDAFVHLTAPIHRYGGTVARLMGDAILAFFGAPFAHEDDPQRAVLAGLDIVESMGPFRDRIRQEFGLDFNVRVGINTGPVVVGEVVSDMAGEYTAMGDAVNVAARMEQTALPGSLQVSGDTHKLIAPLFEFESLGGVEVKGKSEPVEAYRVLAPKTEPGRLRGIEGLSAPMIGRGDEMETLRQVITEVRQGRGHIVCLIGEAGLGKSRLLEELRAEWSMEGGSDSSWLESRGVSYDAARPYGLFQQRMHQIFDVKAGDLPEVVRNKIANRLQNLGPEQLALFTQAVELILSVRQDSDEPQLPGESLKRELFQGIYNVWRDMASQAPLVMVFDDLHWADPASVELLLHMIQLTEEVPVLFLCAFRPERQSTAWRVKQAVETDYPHRYTEITLKPLSNEDSSSLVDSLLTIADLPVQLRQLILQKAEGNPFFVEEVVRTLIDSGTVVQDEGGLHWHAPTNVEDIPIPDNLQALLTSRIDRLEEEARHTLQLAAVIGRSFYHRVLKFVSDPAIPLDKQLSALQRVELIREAARIPELEYVFRHELTRDAAYNSILRRRRREFHQHVGEAIETLFPDRLEEQAHRLAHHFSEARDDERALKYSTMAGDAAARLYANAEAITHYTHALELAKGSAGTTEQIIHLYTSCGRAQELSGQYDDALANYQEFESLAHERDDDAMRLAALLPQATVHSTYTGKFDPERGEQLSKQALIFARELEDHLAEAKALWNLMLLAIFASWDPQKAIGYGEQSLAIAREHDLQEQIAFTLHDISRAYAAAGHIEQAWSARQESGKLWRKLSNLPMLTDNLTADAAAYFELGEFDRSISLAEEALRISVTIGNLWGQAGSVFSLVPIYLERGEIDKGIQAVEDSLALAQAGDFAAMPAFVNPIMAWVYGSLGEIDHGFELARAALAKADEMKVNEAIGARPLALAALAHLHLLKGDWAEAQARINEAYGELGSTEAALDSGRMGLLLIFNVLIRGEVALANKESDEVVRLANRTITSMHERGIRIFLSDTLRLKGQALLGLGHTSEAREALAEARAEAEALGSRRSLWPILSVLSRLEDQHGNHAEAETLRQQAKEIIEYIADHTGTTELRASFLNVPQVREVMAPG